MSMKDAFLTTDIKTVKKRSRQNAHEYTLSINWTTPEYLSYVHGNQRKKEIESIRN